MGSSIPSEMSSFSDDTFEPEYEDDDDDDDDEPLPRAALASFAPGLTSRPKLSRPPRSRAGVLRIVDSSAHGGPLIANDSAKFT